MKLFRRLNFRLALAFVLLLAGAARQVAGDHRPSVLRPGLRMYAYVANTADGTLTVVDLAGLHAVATIPVGPTPSGLRAHPTRDEVWGVSTAGGYVWVLNTRTGAEVARIHVGQGAFALDFSPDGRRTYLAASGTGHASNGGSAGRVVAVDCETRKVLASVHVGRRPWVARLTPDGRTVVVPNREDGTVSLFAAEDLAHLATIAVARHPEQVAILPDSSKAFVSAAGSNQISVVDLRRKVLLTNLPLGGPAADLILKPDGGELYVPAPQSRGLAILNTMTNEVAENLVVGYQPAQGTLTRDARTLYISDPATGQVRPIVTAFRQLLPPISVGQRPGTSLLTPQEELLLVVNEGSEDLAVVRTRTQDLLTLIPLGHRPRDLAIKVF